MDSSGRYILKNKKFAVPKPVISTVKCVYVRNLYYACR